MKKFKGKIVGILDTGYEELDYAYGDVIEELSTGRCFIVDLDHFDDSTLLKDVVIEVFPNTIIEID